ncbi:hypothetical protein OAD14_00550 [Flavobacteriaceae bacterium]|nr:hypothetical protein [Flavobacteriaceae bacterium]|tara:strand:- start:198 stop:593 length:396 start_codon:yes stop_codon:yes gene_type:complete
MNLGKLINKGLITVYGPLMTFVISSTLITYWITKDILKLQTADIITTVFLFVFIFIGWIWWSYKIVKWKYFAFSKLTIDESYELYSKAIDVGLIWPTGSIFNKTEIWTNQDKKKWMNINPEIREIFELEDE